jgi:hypothetical protein
MRRPKFRADSFEILMQQDLSFRMAALVNVDVREAGERLDGVGVVWAEDLLFAGPSELEEAFGLGEVVVWGLQWLEGFRVDELDDTRCEGLGVRVTALDPEETTALIFDRAGLSR